MMDFSPAESQQAVAGLAAKVLAELKADAWKELAQAGLLALSVPARLGGDGLGVLEVAVLLTEIGRRARPDLPQKAMATLMTGVLPVVRWGSSDCSGRCSRPSRPATGCGRGPPNVPC
jgi:alkylation response protein AidB-like acyl-CoA dehydrogenase